MKLIFATRPSALARWQTEHISRKLQAVWDDLECELRVITTTGDQVLDKPLPEIGGKGLFTYELEQALLKKQVDAAVHSLKDLPTEQSLGLEIGCIPTRVDARDVLICPHGYNLDELPPGSVIGTSSIRRQAQLLKHRPDVVIKPLRGNVDTRLRKVSEGQYDAIILAAAGVIRLGLENHITQFLPFEQVLPAPGQGALAVQCRADDKVALRTLSQIDDRNTRLAVTAERSFLSDLGGGCSLPVAAYATYTGSTYHLTGFVSDAHGRRSMRVEGHGIDPVELGSGLARQVLLEGAADLLHSEFLESFEE